MFVHSEKLNPCKCGSKKTPDLDSDDVVPCWGVKCYDCGQFQNSSNWSMAGAVKVWNLENPVKPENKELMDDRDVMVLNMYRLGKALNGDEGKHDKLVKLGYLDSDLELTDKALRFIKTYPDWERINNMCRSGIK